MIEVDPLLRAEKPRNAQTIAFVDPVRRRESALHQGLGGDEVLSRPVWTLRGSRPLTSPNPFPPAVS